MGKSRTMPKWLKVIFAICLVILISAAVILIFADEIPGEEMKLSLAQFILIKVLSFGSVGIGIVTLRNLFKDEEYTISDYMDDDYGEE